MRTAGHRSRDLAQRGQILPLFALGLVALVGGVALVVDGSNAYVQQRGAQNVADSAANAAADVLAERLKGLPFGDGAVATAISAVQGGLSTSAYYTNVFGQPIDASGNVVAPSGAAAVGSGSIPLHAQGVELNASQTFATTFGRVIGISTLTASGDARAIAGKIAGGYFLPLVFPVNITDCSGGGSLGIGESQWPIAQPGIPPNHPVGQEYIVPLCKTGDGSFMVLNLDGIMNDCSYEVTNPTAVQFNQFPTDVPSDNGNNCAKAMADAVNQTYHDKVALIPVCDATQCNTSGGSQATYHIASVVGFYIDYMEYSNNPTDSLCQTHLNSSGDLLVTITGNGSSSCIAGWFVRFISAGPVVPGDPNSADAIGIQLSR